MAPAAPLAEVLVEAGFLVELPAAVGAQVGFGEKPQKRPAEVETGPAGGMGQPNRFRDYEAEFAERVAEQAG